MSEELYYGMHKHETILRTEKWGGRTVKNVPYTQEYFVVKDLKTDRFEWKKSYCYIGGRELMKLSKLADYMEENNLKEMDFNDWMVDKRE